MTSTPVACFLRLLEGVDLSSGSLGGPCPGASLPVLATFVSRTWYPGAERDPSWSLSQVLCPIVDGAESFSLETGLGEP